MTYKDDFKQQYKRLIEEDWKYILINIKKNRLPAIETVIIRKESFEEKLKEILYMYDDNMYFRLKKEDEERREGKPPLMKIIGIYGMTTDVFEE